MEESGNGGGSRAGGEKRRALCPAAWTSWDQTKRSNKQRNSNRRNSRANEEDCEEIWINREEGALRYTFLQVSVREDVQHSYNKALQ